MNDAKRVTRGAVNQIQPKWLKSQPREGTVDGTLCPPNTPAPKGNGTGVVNEKRFSSTRVGGAELWAPQKRKR